MIAAVLSKVGRLWTDYTTARAAKLDFLDASVAARPTNPLLTTDSRLNNLDASVAARPTNPLLTTDSRLNNLDALISSRAPDKGQKVFFAQLTTTSMSWTTLLNVSGAGTLSALSWVGINTINYMSGLRITIDGGSSVTFTPTNILTFVTATPTNGYGAMLPFDLRFKTSCLVEVQCNTAASMAYTLIYGINI